MSIHTNGTVAGIKPKRLANPYIYGLGMLGLTIPGQMFSMYFPFYYNTQLSLTMISIGMVIYTIWDAVNDPLMGFFSDRTRTKLGRRKPWLLFGAPLYCVCFVLFFAPPALQQNSISLLLYFTIFLLLTETMSTINLTNYHSLFPELFRSSEERTSANAFRQALQYVGLIIGSALTGQLVIWLGGNDPEKSAAIGYPFTALLFSVLGMALLLLAVFKSRENKEYWEASTPGLKESFKALVKNRNFWTVGLTNFFYQATVGILVVSIPFFVYFILDMGKDTTILSASVFVTAIPAMLLWRALIRKWGTLKIWRIALACLGISMIPMFFVNTLLTASIAGAFIGISLAGVTANIDLINAKIIDADAAASGLRREAIYVSALNFTIKLSGLFKSLVFILITVIFGFENIDKPGNHPSEAVRFMITILPVILMALSFVTSLFVKFKDEGVKND